jgi:hypothetical protein
MFCPACGFKYTQKTNYCKRCGEELNASPQPIRVEPPRLRLGGMFFIVALFGAIGLLINLLSYHELIDERRVSGGEALITFALGLLLVGGIAGFLIRQLSRLITGYQKWDQAPAPERVIIREVQAPQIGLPADSPRSVIEAPSVVEHTTRQIANLYEIPKAAE